MNLTKNKMTKSQMFESMPIPALIRSMAWPAIVAFAVSSVYNMVDTAFITRLGEAQSAASIVALPVFIVVNALGLAIGIGASSFISRLMGEKNIQRASEVLATAIITSVIIGIFISTTVPHFAKDILLAIGATRENLHYALDYIIVLIHGSMFTMLNMTLNNLLRAEGSSKISMYGIILGAVINVILDPIFMFDWGLNLQVFGASLATVISQAISTIVLFGFYLAKKTNIEFHIKNFSPSFYLYSNIFKVGIPSFFIQTLMSLAMVLINKAAGAYGDVAITAMGISSRLMQFGAMIVIGYAQGYQPVAGYSFGSKNYDRMKEAYYHTMKTTIVFGAIFSAIMIIFAKPIVALFNPSEQIVNIGALALRGTYSTFFLFGFTMTNSYTFQAYGRARESLVLSISRQGLILVPLVIFLPKFFNFYGVILATPIADVLSALLTYILMRKIKKLYFE